MQLYDQEEVMKVHILSERRDSAIRATDEAFREVGLSFVDVVEKTAAKFSLSKETAEREVFE